MTLNRDESDVDSKPKPRFPERPYYYAWGGDKRMYAYTHEEWGMGGSLPNGGNTTVRSWVFQFVLAIIMIPAALMSLLMLIVAIFSLNWILMIFGLVCTPVFAAAPYVGFTAANDERRARKARKLRGLPKPATSVTDERARRYFEEHPESGVAISKENFPDGWKSEA